MKLLIASDIHGSAYCARQLMNRFDQENPDTLVLLGDILYHGPRNALPEGYAPMEVAQLLNARAEHIVAVRGNCDAEVDQMVLDFPCMADYTVLEGESMRLFLTHGHVYGPSNLPKLPKGGKPWALCSGHTHVKVLREQDGVTLLNPGSVSLPKDGSRSYAVYENGAFTLKLLESGSTCE